MKNQTGVLIGNTRKVHRLIYFNHHEEMLNATLRDITGNLEMKSRAIGKKLLRKFIYNSSVHIHMFLPSDRNSRDIRFCHKRRVQHCCTLLNRILVKLLYQRDDDTTLRINTFGMSFDSLVITKCNVNKATLIGAHRGKLHSRMLLHSTSGSRASHGSNLLVTTALISFDIHNNRITEPELATHNEGYHGLKGFKRAPMSTNQHGKIGSCDVEDQFSFTTFILVDGSTLSIKLLKNIAQHRDRYIGNLIEILIGQFLTSLVLAGKLRISTDDLVGILGRINVHLFNFSIDNELFIHNKLLNI